MVDRAAGKCTVDTELRLEVYEKLCELRDLYTTDCDTELEAWRDTCEAFGVHWDDKLGAYLSWPLCRCVAVSCTHCAWLMMRCESAIRCTPASCMPVGFPTCLSSKGGVTSSWLFGSFRFHSRSSPMWVCFVGGWEEDAHFAYTKVLKEISSRGRGQVGVSPSLLTLFLECTSVCAVCLVLL